MSSKLVVRGAVRRAAPPSPSAARSGRFGGAEPRHSNELQAPHARKNATTRFFTIQYSTTRARVKWALHMHAKPRKNSLTPPDPRLVDLFADLVRTYEPPDGMTALEWSLNTEEGNRAAYLIRQAEREAEDLFARTPELKGLAYKLTLGELKRALERFKPAPKKRGRKLQEWVRVGARIYSSTKAPQRWDAVKADPVVLAELVARKAQIPGHQNKGSVWKMMKTRIRTAANRRLITGD